MPSEFIKPMTFEEVYNHENRQASKEELQRIADSVLKMRGNVIIICKAKKAKLWPYSDQETADYFLSRRSVNVNAIAIAKSDGWWPYSNEDTVAQIIKTTHDPSFAIHLAVTNNWWTKTKEEAAEIILKCKRNLETTHDTKYGIYKETTSGPNVNIICHAKRNGWWPFSDEETSRQILSGAGDIVTAIALAKNDGWWPFNAKDTVWQIFAFTGRLERAIETATSPKLKPKKRWWPLPASVTDKRIKKTLEERIKKYETTIVEENTAS